MGWTRSITRATVAGILCPAVVVLTPMPTRASGNAIESVGPDVYAVISSGQYKNRPLLAKGLHPVTPNAAKSANVSATVLHDDKNLYVQRTCLQGDAPIAADQKVDGMGFRLDDFMGIGIDTSGRGSQVYYLEVAAGGVKYQWASETKRYEPTWSAQASKVADGRAARMEIPPSKLGLHPEASGWRSNFVRHIASGSTHAYLFRESVT
jgi:hypothetical protein